MNTIKNLCLAAALLLAPGLAMATSLGLSPAINSFSAASTNTGSALSWAVVSARSGNGGTPAVMFASVGSDLAAAKLQAYRVTATCKVQFTNSTVTLFVNNTNGFGSGASDVIIIQHLQNDWYEKRILTSNSDTTNLVVTVAPTQAVIPGDIIYRCTTTGAAAIPIAANVVSTNTIAGSGSPILVGQQGLPLLLEVNGTSAASLYSATGVFVPPVAVPRAGL